MVKQDWVKSIIMAFLGTFITGLIKYLEMGTFPQGDQWKAIIITGLSTGLAYLLKNFLTNSQDKFITPEPK